MAIPRKQHQWEIYRANLDDANVSYLLVISSNETNEILNQQVLACEVVLETTQRLAETPVTIKAKARETGLEDAATISVATLASIPRSCLVELEGRLDSVALRLAVDRGLQILIGNQRWP
jgi:hypothetical protein